MEKQSIAFAHYKNGELIGYRQDTFGTLGKDWAKLYTYSKDQVETVLTNIRYTLGSKKKGVGETLLKLGIDPQNATLLKEAEDKTYEEGQKLGAFEVRVVKAPDKIYEREFDVQNAEWVTSPWGQYPAEEMKAWLENPETHETIETHFFSMEGQLNMQ